MKTATFRKTMVAMAVAGTFAAGTIPEAEANVVNLSWRGAFTMLSPVGSPVSNNPSDYAQGYYANGDSNTYSFGAPYFPGNLGPGAIPSPNYPGAYQTAFGWYGRRTPISGTMSFDTSTGAGVGTVNSFYFFGDTPGSGPGTLVARFSNVTFQAIDTIGTVIGTMLVSWNGGGHSISIVLDASGLFANLPAMLGGGPTSSLSGVGALPASDGINFGTAKFPAFLPLGPSPVATKTLNTGGGAACDGQPIATQVSPSSIISAFPVLAACTTGMVDDGIGGDPMTSPAFSTFNANLDFTTFHFDSFVIEEPVPDPVPDPFSFIDQTDVAFRTEVVSDPITVTGINTDTPISVTDGEYSIDGGAFTSAAGTVTADQSVRVRHRSRAGFLKTTGTTLTIGGVSDTFNSTTLANPGRGRGGGGGVPPGQQR